MSKKRRYDDALRRELLEKMTPETRGVASQFETLFATEHCGGLVLRHDVGARLAVVIAEEARYGSGAVEQIAMFLGTTPDRLYKMRQYAQSYSRAEVEQLAARRTRDGGRIRYHHLAALLVVRSPDARRRFLERLFAESMSVRALRAAIAAADATPDAERAGDGRQRKSLVEQLGQNIERTQTMVKKSAGWADVFDGVVGRTSAGQVDALVRGRVLMAQTVLDELDGRLGQLRARCAEVAAAVRSTCDERGDEDDSLPPVRSAPPPSGRRGDRRARLGSVAATRP